MVSRGRTYFRAFDCWCGRYGDWTAESPEIPIITDFVAGLGGTEWWGMNAAYTDTSLAPASTSLTYVTRSFDYYSQGPMLTEGNIMVRGLPPTIHTSTQTHSLIPLVTHTRALTPLLPAALPIFHVTRKAGAEGSSLLVSTCRPVQSF